VSAIALLLLAGCGGAEPDGPEQPSTLRVVAELDGGGGMVVVTDDGDPVTGAQVALNGTPASPGGAAGEYLVALAAPVAPGGMLTLEVESGGAAAVAASHAVPHLPVILEPSEPSSFTPAEDIEVAWAIESDPDSFVVEAVGESTHRFQVTGGARQFVIPGGSLPEGQWHLRVHAVRDGFVGGHVESGSRMRIVSTDEIEQPIPVIAPLLRVIGTYHDYAPNIGVCLKRQADDGLEPVDDATVAVNGTMLGPIPSADSTSSCYIHTWPSRLPVGTLLDLRVSAHGSQVEGVGTVPAEPVVDDPAEGAILSAQNSITVTWTNPGSDPDYWIVSLRRALGTYPYLGLPGDARSATFPAGSVLPNEYDVVVVRSDLMDLTGHVAPSSTVNLLAGEGSHTRITVTP
jgi:hypothetical protein